MSFSQELKDFTTAAASGFQLANQSAKTAAEKKHYDALENYYGARMPDQTPPINPDYIEEGQGVFGPGGTGLPSAVPASPDTYDPAKAPAFLSDVGKKYAALPPDYLTKSAWIENGFRPTGGNSHSSAGGMFQFTDDTAKQYGLTNKNDPVASADAAARYALDNSKGLQSVLGRNPTGAEIYLAHQQGLKGAAQLLRNPNTPAIAIVGKDAVVNNGGRLNMTAGEFANMWLNKYNSLGPKAAHGGMIHHYEDGGAVDAQKPYYADDLMNDVGDALGKLGDVVRGGFQAVSDMFGLNERPAVAQADPDYMKRVEAYARAPGAPSQQVQEVKSTVDPNGELGDALATTYGMVKSYEYHLKNGNTAAANKAAGQILLYTRMKSQQLGALAVQALQEGDESTATKAIQQAYNFLPNAQKIEMRDGKATLIDQKTGNVVREVEFTPATLLKAAYGFTNGEAFLNDIQGVMQSEKEKVAGIKADSAVNVAAINASAKTDAATIGADARKDITNTHETHADARNTETVQGRRDVAAGNNETAVNVANIGATSRQSVAETNASARLQGVDKQQEGANNRNSANNQRAVDVANINQGGANYRNENTNSTNERIATGRNETNERIATGRNETSRANNSDTNKTRLQTVTTQQQGANDRNAASNQRAVDVANINQTGAAQRTEATNASRETIARGRDETSRANTATNAQTKVKTTMDILDAKASEGDKNRASREGIAAGNQATSRANTQDRVAGAAEQGAANRASREGIAAGNQATSRANTDARVTGAAEQGAANRASREGIAAGNQATSRANTDARVTGAAEQGAANRAVRQSEGAANRGAAQTRVDTRVSAAAEQGDKNRALRASEGEANRGAAMDRVGARTGNARDMMTRRVTGRQHDAVEKMTDYEILGKDEASGAKVSTGQAQATRTIAHGILDSNRGFGRQGVDYARQLTAWDSANRRPLTRVKLNEGEGGYSVTMPDGVTLKLDEPTFRQVQRIHGAPAR